MDVIDITFGFLNRFLFTSESFIDQDSIMLILMFICLSSDDYSLVGLVSALPSEINSDFENC